jgi:hypothetical protein
MAQHFLLSAAARTFSLMALCQVSEEGAYLERIQCISIEGNRFDRRRSERNLLKR